MMRKLNPAHVEATRQVVNNCPFFHLLSMRILTIEQGASLLEIALAEKHLQPYGLVHGGVTAAILDAAAFWAVYADVDEGFGLTTVEMKVNYLAPASAGRLIGKGRSIKSGRTLCLGEASIKDDTGRLLAHGTATLMVMPALELQGQAALPPKFL